MTKQIDIPNGMARKMYSTYASVMTDAEHGYWLDCKREQLQSANTYDALKEIERMDARNRAALAKRIRVSQADLQRFLHVFEHLQIYDEND
jgi:ssDNA-specific exonuclease RecJ